MLYVNELDTANTANDLIWENQVDSNDKLHLKFWEFFKLFPKCLWHQ